MNILKNKFRDFLLKKITDEKMDFLVFSNLLHKYNMDFIYEDSLGILTRRKYTDNFEYIFETRNSCDAQPMMKALSKKIENSRISFDVGANIGITSIWLARNSDIVYSFEPESNNIKRFQENIALNNIENVILSPCAVTNYEGKAEFNIYDDYGHHSLGKVDPSGIIIKTEEVKAITLDGFCHENHIETIDCLKVDVEGFELEVFQGANNLLQNHQIKLIIFEFSKQSLKTLGKKPQNIFNLLHSNGYQVYDLTHKHIDSTTFEDLIYEDVYATC